MIGTTREIDLEFPWQILADWISKKESGDCHGIRG
jgi:hypothetical protein